jgi:membrane-bound lytic murein transglycosylase D
MVQSAQRWAQENLDENVLRVLKSADQKRVKQLLTDMEKEFQGDYIVDLAPLKHAANDLLPVLESYQETLPYALWLKNRLDYLDVADHFRLLIKPPKQIEGRLPKPPPNPPARQQREIWIKKVADRPWPKAAHTYVSRLKPIFAAQHLPSELIWIAEVESSFDPRARSPEGAAGMFQLRPATARQYGVSTWPLDRRLRPEDSARAAAKYLEHLHNHFQDWRLALAAWNAGEGTVERLLAKNKARSFDAIATHLPAETQMFVPKVEAVLLKREGVKLGNLRAG